MRNFLFIRIYFSFILVGLFVLFGTMSAGIYFLSQAKVGQEIKVTIESVLITLQKTQTSSRTLQTMFRSIGKRSGTKIGLWNKKGRRIALSESWALKPKKSCSDSIWLKPSKDEIGICFALQDGRWFAMSTKKDHYRGLRNQALGFFVLFFGLIGVGCYPLARSITRRLERLQKGVQDLGEGEFNRRVLVEGSDEVARLALSFNLAAEQIQELLLSQRKFLAAASHDLRTPLGRIRMAMELMQEDLPASKRVEVFSQAKSDITLLNTMIEDILLASTLQQKGQESKQTIDFRALVAAEAQHYTDDVVLTPMELMGNHRMLQRMLQNLLDNAKKYGGSDITVELHDQVLVVSDRGPGVALEFQEKIFSPFFRPPEQREKNDGGVGLGLSLVRDIAHMHGATLKYEDREGGGASFVVDFSSRRKK